MPKSETFITTREAADMLSLKQTATILKYIRRGLLKGIRLGDTPRARWRIDLASVQALADSTKTSHEPET